MVIRPRTDVPNTYIEHVTLPCKNWNSKRQTDRQNSPFPSLKLPKRMSLPPASGCYRVRSLALSAERECCATAALSASASGLRGVGGLGEEQEEKGFRRKLRELYGREEQTSLNNLTESRAHGFRNGSPKNGNQARYKHELCKLPYRMFAE
jgi:hypothetical protein